jgi:outer membrane biogenesis lipoprotein LolB
LAIEALQNDPRLTSGQGNFRWRQTGELATIRLSGPFGAGATEIEWSPTRVVVRAADGTVTAANEGPDAAQLLLTERLGFSWPLSSARCWLRGESCPDAPASRWQVRYDAWWPRDDGRLPRRLTLEDDALRIRIVVDAWEP